MHFDTQTPLGCTSTDHFLVLLNFTCFPSSLHNSPPQPWNILSCNSYNTTFSFVFFFNQFCGSSSSAPRESAFFSMHLSMQGTHKGHPHVCSSLPTLSPKTSHLLHAFNSCSYAGEKGKMEIVHLCFSD